tara:strand:- start:67 stop:675 length:609 start_codon:yes stop_codon:yes gene_type:complete
MLERISEESLRPSDFGKSYCLYLSDILAKLDYDVLNLFIDTLIEARGKGKNIFVIGNGGSASTASHMANDLAIGASRYTSKPFKVTSLTDNNAVISAIGNDFGYDEIFKKQLSVLMVQGDLLIAISASGNSPNIINAVKFSKMLGNKVLGLSGFDGGALKHLSDVCINVKTPKNEYGPVEDIHMIINHLISNYLFNYLKTSN